MSLWQICRTSECYLIPPVWFIHLEIQPHWFPHSMISSTSHLIGCPALPASLFPAELFHYLHSYPTTSDATLVVSPVLSIVSTWIWLFVLGLAILLCISYDFHCRPMHWIPSWLSGYPTDAVAWGNLCVLGNWGDRNAGRWGTWSRPCLRCVCQTLQHRRIWRHQMW